MRIPTLHLSLRPSAGPLAAEAAAAPAEGKPGSALLVLLALGVAVAVAAWAVWTMRRRAEARARAVRAAAALAEAQPWAEVGQEVARVTHRLANAVAIARTNVRWLSEEPGPRDEAERREVLGETLAAVERIAAIAADLRRIAGEARPGGAPAPPADVGPETPGG